jgi:CRISPR-associated protein Csd1
MIKELCEFGKRIRTGHDALKDEPISIDLIIKDDGSFVAFSIIEKISRPAEAITAKKGKARLLLDKAEEVLCYGGEKSKKKHLIFIDKLNLYVGLEILSPVFAFYRSNRENGVNRALQEFGNQVEEKERGGNIAFRINEMRIHEQKEVYEAIIERFERSQIEQLKGKKKECSICSKTDFPVLDQPHGLIKRVPDGQSAGCALISYNENAFESYDLTGNDNSSVCTNCAKNYVEGLNYLLTNGYIKGISDYTNRKNFGSDTAMVFWTREPEALDEMNWFDKPDAGRVANLIESVANAQKNRAANIKSNQFYSLTLSGAAARIAIRDWIEISLDEYKQNIAKWFEDTAIRAYGEKRYFPLYVLARAGHNTKSDSDPTNSRIATQLWNAALKNTVPSLWILNAVLKRIRFVEQTADGQPKDSVTPERAALLRFVLNRNNKNGGYMIKEQNDPNDKNSAIICGKIFAVMESIQRAALGKEINAGIRERFFSFVSTSPAPAFGRLMKLSQNHISKLKHEKPGLAIILDKQLQELCSLLNVFPPIFSLEEQGQFALGYYHQKQEDYDNYKNNKEMQSLIENYKEE